MTTALSTTSASSAGRHAAYLTGFLNKGFAALTQLEHLDRCIAEDKSDWPELLGLGEERAGKLLAACNAEPSLLSAIYWVVCAHALLVEASLPQVLQERALAMVLSCRCAEGGFAPHPKHGPHLLSTLSAVQLCILLGHRNLLEVGGACRETALPYVRSLRLSDGSFCGRAAKASEGDCRFVYAGLCALFLLRSLADSGEESLQATRAWLLKCQNLDGGFGCRPHGECESHAGHTFCCLASLRLVAAARATAGVEEPLMPRRSLGRLIRWLCDRQCRDGGLNGRPGKAADVCYTWWTLASVENLRAAETTATELADFVAADRLRDFWARCASAEGGVAAHPGEDPDPFHTFFGLAGLSLLEEGQAPAWLGDISPLVALPRRLLDAGGEGS